MSRTILGTLGRFGVFGGFRGRLRSGKPFLCTTNVFCLVQDEDSVSKNCVAICGKPNCNKLGDQDWPVQIQSIEFWDIKSHFG